MKTSQFLCVLLFSSVIYADSTTQSLPGIQNAVHRFVESALIPDGQYQISSAQIDERLQLPACGRDLEVSSQSGEIKPGRNTVGIRCSVPENWTIYSTVLVKSFKKVLVLSKQLNRHDTISAAHLSAETRDVATLQQGYLVAPADVLDKQAPRSLSAGTVLTRNHYAEPTLIKRGERVSIQSGRAGLLITSKGVAMMNGAQGQQIRVKNVSSQRVIQATVTRPGVVTVYF